MKTHSEPMSIEDRNIKESRKMLIKLLISLFFYIALLITMYALAVGYKYTFPSERPSFWSWWLIKAGVVVLFHIPIVLAYKIRPLEQKGHKKVYIIISLIFTVFAVAFWLGYAHFSWYK